MHASPSASHHSPFVGFANMSSSTSAPNLGSSNYGMSNPNYGHSSTGYQSGYLSTSLLTPSNTTSTSNAQPQTDANDSSPSSGPPIIPTKAKMNHLLASGNNANNKDFGLNSRMGLSTRKMSYHMDDVDAPPTMSIHDEDASSSMVHSDSFRQSAGPGWFTGENPTRKPIASPSMSLPYTYVIVFGYPPSKYAQTVAHFQSFSSGGGENEDGEGAAVTAPEPLDVMNAFKIGYLDPADAMRAVRRNGEVVAGEWMIGVRYADSSLSQSQTVSPPPPQPHVSTPVVAERRSMLGTPSKTSLMPSTSAFRTPVKGSGPPRPLAATPVNTTSGTGTPQLQNNAAGTPGQTGVLGQVSNLIFGW